MKRYLLPLIGAVVLCAEPIAIKESPNRTGYYEIAPQSAQIAAPQTQNNQPIGFVKPDRNRISGAKANSYYKNGDPSQEYVSTGSVIISFDSEKTQSDIEAFASKWQLSNAKQISQMFHTWTFSNDSSDDDLTLVSKIGRAESDISFAKPDFIAKVKIR
ncbi:MAG: hypothetical protein LBI57_07790 [Helicobacteraceae bacterium]|jgi:hypothetical protein|nr:hypothetical protein [Helicobacteraceae bacterium]